MKYVKNKITLLISYICVLTFFSSSITVYAEPEVESSLNSFEIAENERKSLPIQSDSYENWPIGPKIGAEAAILMDADTGVILYEKNIHERLYPASITKILTTLIAAEKCNLNDMVTFSHDAIFSITRDSSNAGLDVGESITVEQCLYAILVGSANEAANGLAEHVAGSMESFADLMNEKANELGCLDSHFVTTNGLHNENHYTTAYDMAMIGRAFFNNELLCHMASTPIYQIPQTKTQPDANLYLKSKNQLYKGNQNEYEYLVGSKTGYTDHARQTLVSCAQKDGLKLICVVLKEESPHQFTDTVTLFDYGFENFKKYNISSRDSIFNIKSPSLFSYENTVLGKNYELFNTDNDSFVVIPKDASLEDLDYDITLNKDKTSNKIADIDIKYYGTSVGKSSVFHSNTLDNDTIQTKKEVHFINIIYLILFIASFSWILEISIALKSYKDSYQFSKRNKRNKKKPRATHPGPYDKTSLKRKS